MRKKALFATLLFAGFIAALWLKFFSQGWLRGNLYDVVLVAFQSSATFLVINQVRTAMASGIAPTRQVQAALNWRVCLVWAAIACGAELIQGLATFATGKAALGTFDPLDLACYLAGALLSFCMNRLLYSGTPGAKD